MQGQSTKIEPITARAADSVLSYYKISEGSETAMLEPQRVELKCS